MEKPVLTMSAKQLQPIRPSALLVSLTAIATLLLSACGTLPGQTASRQTDDTPAMRQAGSPLSTWGEQRVAAGTRQDPASGLRVDLGPGALRNSPTEPNPESLDAIGKPTDPLEPDAPVNLGDATSTQDLWGRIRRGYGLPTLESTLVNDHERWYASRPEYVQRMTSRGGRYLYHVVEEISRRKMPTELALLPFIESAFNPQAMSSARASGMWQFMPATGKDFELKQNLFRDDRRDVLASTRAALDYLQRLHRMFGDWHLALAAYNWGEGNVQRAIQRNQRQGLPTDYMSLNMPAETRHYVPKLHAVRNIVMQPERFGLALPPLENHPYFVSVPIQRDMDVSLATRLAGLSTDEFKALNPSQNKPVILAAGTPQLLLPYDNANLFVHNLSRHKGPLATWTAWQVPRTMRPAEAAKSVGMSEASLREVNHIPPKMLVKAGSTLLVPRPEHREQDVSESLADNAMMALAPDLPPMKRMVVKAGKRDSVASIARRYKVSADQVAQWNRTSARASFTRGQNVVVFVPTGGKRQLASAGGKVGKQAQATANARKVKLASSARTNPTKGNSKASARNGKVRVASAR